MSIIIWTGLIDDGDIKYGSWRIDGHWTDIDKFYFYAMMRGYPGVGYY